MNSLNDIALFRSKYGSRPLIVDTNILFLLLIGDYDKNFIKECDLTKKYCIEDFALFKKIVKYFDSEIIITPQIIAEVSNLSKINIKDPHFHIYFQRLLDRLRCSKEHHITLGDLVDVGFKLLSSFGFTDISIIETAKKINGVVLTDEVNMYQTFCRIIPMIKFSHIKTAGYL